MHILGILTRLCLSSTPTAYTENAIYGTEPVRHTAVDTQIDRFVCPSDSHASCSRRHDTLVKTAEIMGCDCTFNTAQASHASYVSDNIHGASESLEFGNIHICDTLPKRFYLTPPHSTPPLVANPGAIDFEFTASLDEPMLLDDIDVLNFTEQPQFKVANTTQSSQAHALPDLPALSCWPHEQTTSSMAPAQTTTCPNVLEKCMAACLRILKVLRGSSQDSGCLFSKSTASGSQKGRQLDAVLGANRYAINTISRVLACPCLRSAAVQLLLISICDKLRAWNHAILDCGVPKQEEGSEASGSSSQIGTVIEKVGEQPFKVGDFALDDGLGARFRAYLVREELQRLEDVVQRVVGRPAAAAAAAAAPPIGRASGHFTSLSESAQQDLGRLLRSRLQAARVTTVGRIETAAVGWCN
jgi:hypothetical protein